MADTSDSAKMSQELRESIRELLAKSTKINAEMERLLREYEQSQEPENKYNIKKPGK